MEDNNSSNPPFQTPRTPPRPPYSPVTPIMAQPTLVPLASGSETVIPPSQIAASTSGAFSYSPSQTSTPQPQPQTQPAQPQSQPQSQSQSQSTQPSTAQAPAEAPIFQPEPAPIPISESTNPDAIALRSAISILQIQKQQALRDIRALDDMKAAARDDPQGFARDLVDGKLGGSQDTGMNVGDVFSPPVMPVPKSTNGKVKREEKSPGEDIMNVEEDTPEQEDQDQDTTKPSKFGTIPKPQNVIRMPPINWAKYHIVGEPLDKMHEEQRRRPTPGEPRRDTVPPQRSPEHVIAAPYRPFTDKLDSPMKTRNSNKRKSDQG